MRGLGNKNLENLRLESWNFGQNKAEMQISIFLKNEKGRGALERRIDGKLVG